MTPFVLTLRMLILHLLILLPFGTLTLAHDVTLNVTKIIDNGATAAPSAHLDARSEAFIFKFCAKINWGGQCYNVWLQTSEISTNGSMKCLRCMSFGSWASYAIESSLHKVDIYRDAHCQTIGLKGVTQPGVENMFALGFKNFTSDYFSIRAWLL
jgi:hypothetical protein